MPETNSLVDLFKDKSILAILCTGIALIGISVLTICVNVMFLGSIEYINLLAPVIVGAGISLIIMATVEASDWRKSLNAASDRIVDQSIDNLKKLFKFLENSQYNGLIDILAPRLDGQRGEETQKIIADEIKASKEVSIFCISGLDYFRPIKGVTRAGISYTTIYKKITGDAKSDLKIRALLMDPTSDAAKLRDKIESSDIAKGDIKGDITIALDGINSLNAQVKYRCIDYRLYSIFPPIHCVITDNCIFVELYHFAPTKELCESLDKKGLMPEAPNAVCTGGRVPVLKFSNRSTMYVAMLEYFNSIWEESKNTAVIAVPATA